MVIKLYENSEMFGEEMMDINTDSCEWQVWKPLRYLREICRRHLGMGEEEMAD